MKNLRAGLVGLGMMGRHHARVLASLPGVDFVGVSDPAGDIDGVAQGRPVFKSVAELIALDIDYAIVAVPTIFHLEVGTELATAGIHAMVEKPISQDTVTSKALARAFDKAGLVGAVGHIERYNPALQEARRRLGQLGSLYQVVTRRQGSFPTRIADVGVVIDLATHDIDLTAWITRQRYSSVSARTALRTGHEHEDLVAIIGTLQDGTITNHLVNWLSPLKERVTIITGEKGAFVADTLTADLTFYANGTVTSEWEGITQFRGVSEGDVIRYAISKHEPLRVEHENFRDAVLGKSADIVTMEQGLATILVAEAVIESARINQTIEIQS
ncbi:MAG TPA: Gfo/Idh/MocA family oxidoreductase [Candidatus Paceibacterota bacterium]|nr:Gfo/Idh/MocA family oxidoreductase [Candidatus Paceibacterota bacterium]